MRRTIMRCPIMRTVISNTIGKGLHFENEFPFVVLVVILLVII